MWRSLRKAGKVNKVYKVCKVYKVGGEATFVLKKITAKKGIGKYNKG